MTAGDLIAENPVELDSKPQARDERPDASGELELRMLELRHRIKNIMGVVQSLVNQTLRDGVSAAEARDILTGRLGAVSQAVDLLLSGDWEAASLSRLIRSAMTMGTDRTRLSGPQIEVGPSTAMMLSILFHELECNAAKYGSLSADGGTVSVQWAIERGAEERVTLIWEENGGPEVKVPAQQGFGSTLVSRILGRFDGEAVPEFRAEGLRWHLSAPLASFRS